MMQQWEIFRREKTNWKINFLIKPRLNPAVDFELPRNSTVHHFDEGPSNNFPLFKNVKRIMSMMHVTELSSMQGKPIKLAVVVEEGIRKFHQRNRRYRRTYQVKTGTREPLSVFIVNYNSIKQRYNYMGQKEWARYNREYNLLSTMVDEMVKITKESDTNQFVFVDTPRIIPAVSSLRQAENNFQLTHAKLFGDQSLVMTFELWKWLGKKREDSIFSKVPKDKLNKINIVFQDSGVYTIVNLGDLDGLRRADGNTKGVDPVYLQLKLVQMLLNFSRVRKYTVEDLLAGYLEDEVQNENDTEVQETSSDEPETQVIVVDGEPHEVEISEPVESETNSKLTDEAEEFNIEREIHVEGTTKVLTLDKNKDTITEKNLTEEEKELRDIQILEAQLDEQLQHLEEISERQVEIEGEKNDVLLEDYYSTAPLDQAVIDELETLVDTGAISASDYKRYTTLSKKYQSIIAPDGQTLDKFIEIPEEDIKLEERQYKDRDTILDKGMLKSTVKDFHSQYITKVLKKDVAGMVMNLQRAGICITDYQVDRHEDVTGVFDTYTVKLNPIQGMPSTVRFKLPVMDEVGVWTSNGVEYRMRSQNFDLPIRKVNDRKVALSSYYGKVFIERSDKRVSNYGRWLCSAIRAASLDPENHFVKDTRTVNVFDHLVKAPYIYTTLAKEFKTIETKNHFFYLDYHTREQFFGERIRVVEQNGQYLAMGLTRSKDLILVDSDNNLYLHSNGKLEPIDSFVNLMGLDESKAPIETAEIGIMGKVIPIGIVLGYEMGLSNLIKALGVSYRHVMSGTRLVLDPTEYAIRFEDEILVFSRLDRFASLILSGFVVYQKAIKDYSVYSFDRKDVYLNVLETNKITVRHLNEIDLMYKLFIDPITLKILQDMKEPTKFRGLLLRACELLMTDDHPNEVDASQMRIRGYERISGAVYSELVRSVRAHNNRGIKSNYPIEMNPMAVWMNIAKDPSVSTVANLNPIQSLKELEAVTFAGTNGRSKVTMVERTRLYDKNSLGVISEGTVDSGDVGVNTYLSGNPQLKSVYGICEPLKINSEEDVDVTKILSTSANLSVACENDDSKRRGFITIMSDHTVPCKGYRVLPVRTGYEQVIASRSTKMFAVNAEENGKVTDISHGIMTVEYESGKKERVNLTRQFGSSGGLTVPHLLVSKYKVGDTIQKDDVIAYNPSYFEADPLDGNVVSWKGGTIARVMLNEDRLTIEDSCAVSHRISDSMTTYSTKIKNIVVNFDQELHRMVKPGDQVNVDDALCIIEDAVTAQSNLFDEESIETLKHLSASVPKAGVKGVVERVEVFYNGYKEDMSDSLRQLADTSDRRFVGMNRSMGKKGFGGEVTEAYRVEGNPLLLDTAVIKVYITQVVPANVGD